MFFAAGVGAYSAAMFHLMTHAFFKALLFLGSGSVINCLHHEQDMRQMGGVKEKAPQTFILMWIGTLALSGIGVPFIMGHGIGFAGFYSKDAILEAAYGAHSTVGMIAYWLGVIGAFMTAFYSTRLMFMTFYGKYRGDHHTWDHAHESPPVMLIPLYVLAAGALLSGVVAYGWFVGEGWEHFWGTSIAVKATEHIIHAMHEVDDVGEAAAAGRGGERHRAELLLLHRQSRDAGQDRPRRSSRCTRCSTTSGTSTSSMTRCSSSRRWRSAGYSGRRATAPRSTGSARTALPPGRSDLAGVLSRFQSGYLYHYAFVMLIGVAALVSYFMLFVR